MYMKGVEGFPFYIFLMILVSALFIGIAFQQLKSYEEMKRMYKAKESYLTILDTVEELKFEANGSFRIVKVEIPMGYYIIFNGTKLTLDGPINTTNDLNVTLRTNFGGVLRQGKYELIIYRGAYSGEELAVSIE